MDFNQILESLPYQRPFLFVEEILSVDENGIKGTYRFREDESFYAGHFVGNPITPGVILTETMAQIGLVCLGIFLLQQTGANKPEQVAFSSSEVNFYRQVKPGEKVTVESKKIFWRLGKLKCRTLMTNEKGEKVAEGTLAGMIK